MIYALRNWWHSVTHFHVQLASPDELTQFRMCWKRFPQRLVDVQVFEEGELKVLTPAQFRFWAKGKGIDIPEFKESN